MQLPRCEYPEFNFDVQPRPGQDGQVNVILFLPTEIAILPFGRDAASQLSDKLRGPSVALPGQNGHGHA